MTTANSAGHAGDVGARPALNELLATTIKQAMHDRKDPSAAAVDAAKAFRAGLAAFDADEAVKKSESTLVTQDSASCTRDSHG